MKKPFAAPLIAGLLLVGACGGGGTDINDRDSGSDISGTDSSGTDTNSGGDSSGTDTNSGGDSSGTDTNSGGDISGTDGSDDIEKWLIEVGNDFPDAAKCVAGEMRAYSVSDFEASFAGTASDAFEQELDAAYNKCDAALGITSEE